jgi:tripartite-type tricarboxylate transporter receptor subunit TctC
MGFTRRGALGAGAAMPIAELARAQEAWPARPIRIIVPFPAGGTTDLLARLYAQRLTETLGQSVVVENRGGGGGSIGADVVAKAAADGHNLLFHNLTFCTTTAALEYAGRAPHSIERDFAPISMGANVPMMLLVNPAVPAKDLKEFVAYVKANAGTLNMAHAGVGSVSYTTCLALNHILQVKPTTVPYGGTGPSMNALVGGQVDYMCDQIVNAVPQINAGTIKVYAIGTPERNPALPNVPTSKEAGLPDWQASAWNALFAPKGTAKPILDKLNAAVVQALDDENVRKRLLELGSEIPTKEQRTPQALADLVKSETERWGTVIKAAGPSN